MDPNIPPQVPPAMPEQTGIPPQAPRKSKILPVILSIFGIAILSTIGICGYLLLHASSSKYSDHSLSIGKTGSNKEDGSELGKRLLFTTPEEKIISSTAKSILYYPLISSNGKHYSYVSRKTDSQGKVKFSVIYDGHDGPLYTDISDSQFSPDGNHFTYIASDDNKHTFPVIDGLEGPKKYSQIGEFTYSKDSKQFAYAAYVLNETSGGSQNEALDYAVAVFNGKEGKHYNGLENIRLSPDGKQLAYIAYDNQGSSVLVVHNDKEYRYPEKAKPTMIIFSPDSKHLAIEIDSYNPTYSSIYLNDTLFRKVNFAGLGYIRFVPKKALQFVKEIPPQWIPFDGNVTEVGSNVIDGSFFSPDGSQYISTNGVEKNKIPNELYELVVNGTNTHIPFGWYDQFVTFTPDNKSFAYSKLYKQSSGKEQYQLVYNSLTSKPYDFIKNALFSPDGKHFAFAAFPKRPEYTDDSRVKIVIDEKESELYDGFYGLYADTDAFRYYVRQGHNFYEVRNKY